MENLVQRIQAYLRTRYLQHDIVAIPPFTIFFHRNDECAEASTAVPMTNTHREWCEPLHEIKNTFVRYGRVPRIEFLDTFAPTLPFALEQEGFVQVNDATVMVCTPETYRPAPAMPGLSTLILSRGLSPENIDVNLQTSELGFDPFSSHLKWTEEGVFQQTLLTDRAFLLRLHRQPVAAGMFAEIHDRITELVGVTTLLEYRHRGFAAYLTGYMTQVAFARQVDLAFMICDNEAGVNMYRHLGYKPYATLLTYQMP